MQNKKNGFFITFEGADGVGKTTQVALTTEYLKRKGYDVLTTREPGGTFTGEKIRNILLDPLSDMGTRTEVLLYLAVRAEHVEKIVLPALQEDKVVISDRFSDSTFVYQGVARKLDIDTIIQINNFAAFSLTPDLTFILDAPSEQLLERMDKRNTTDRIENEGLAFQKSVRNGFLKLAEKYTDRILVINALKEISHIQKEIQKSIDKKL